MAAYQDALQYCRTIARNHYENFPVASVLLPRHLRDPVTIIYAFARTADDLADEGDYPPQQRLLKLKTFQQLVDRIAADPEFFPDDPIFLALAHIIRKYQLDTHLFQQLLQAFIEDVNFTCIKSFEQLMAYCRLSANPVGRLLLSLQQIHSPNILKLSDAICSALQLINFLQDLQKDVCLCKRLYIADDDIEKLHLNKKMLVQHIVEGEKLNTAEQQLMQLQLSRIESLLQVGQQLPEQLHGRFRWQLKVTLAYASKIVQKLGKRSHFSQQMRLSQWEKILLVLPASRTGRKKKSYLNSNNSRL